MIYTITNSGLQNARPTSIGANTINIASKATHTFTISNFTSETSPAYSDPENDALSFISILTLPASGELRVGGVAVNIGDEILSANISTNNFTFVSNQASDVAHSVSFSFDVADAGSNTLSGLSTGVMNINIAAAVNLPPDVIGDNTFILNYGDTKIFTVADFTTGTTPAYNDPEGDNASMIKILTLPVNGTLKFNGSAVIANQEMTVAEVSAGYLVYEPDLLIETLQNLSFEFAVADAGSGQYSQ